MAQLPPPADLGPAFKTLTDMFKLREGREERDLNYMMKLSDIQRQGLVQEQAKRNLVNARIDEEVIEHSSRIMREQVTVMAKASNQAMTGGDLGAAWIWLDKLDKSIHGTGISDRNNLLRNQVMERNPGVEDAYNKLRNKLNTAPVLIRLPDPDNPGSFIGKKNKDDKEIVTTMMEVMRRGHVDDDLAESFFRDYTGVNTENRWAKSEVAVMFNRDLRENGSMMTRDETDINRLAKTDINSRKASRQRMFTELTHIYPALPGEETVKRDKRIWDLVDFTMIQEYGGVSDVYNMAKNWRLSNGDVTGQSTFSVIKKAYHDVETIDAYNRSLGRPGMSSEKRTWEIADRLIPQGFTPINDPGGKRFYNLATHEARGELLKAEEFGNPFDAYLVEDDLKNLNDARKGSPGRTKKDRLSFREQQNDFINNTINDPALQKIAGQLRDNKEKLHKLLVGEAQGEMSVDPIKLNLDSMIISLEEFLGPLNLVLPTENTKGIDSNTARKNRVIHDGLSPEERKEKYGHSMSYREATNIHKFLTDYHDAITPEGSSIAKAFTRSFIGTDIDDAVRKRALEKKTGVTRLATREAFRDIFRLARAPAHLIYSARRVPADIKSVLDLEPEVQHAQTFGAAESYLDEIDKLLLTATEDENLTKILNKNRELIVDGTKDSYEFLGIERKLKHDPVRYLKLFEGREKTRKDLENQIASAKKILGGDPLEQTDYKKRSRQQGESDPLAVQALRNQAIYRGQNQKSWSDTLKEAFRKDDQRLIADLLNRGIEQNFLPPRDPSTGNYLDHSGNVIATP